MSLYFLKTSQMGFWVFLCNVWKGKCCEACVFSFSCRAVLVKVCIKRAINHQRLFPTSRKLLPFPTLFLESFWQNILLGGDFYCSYASSEIGKESPLAILMKELYSFPYLHFLDQCACSDIDHTREWFNCFLPFSPQPCFFFFWKANAFELIWRVYFDKEDW